MIRSLTRPLPVLVFCDECGQVLVFEFSAAHQRECPGSVDSDRDRETISR
jgi:hypothetical protein